MSEQQQTLIEFDNTSFEEKRKQVIRGILLATNFTDVFATTLDWSTSSMQLHASSTIVLQFLTCLDFDRICSSLVGKKTPQEMLEIVCDCF